VSRTSVANAKAELYSLITSPALSGVTATYPFEPIPGQGAKPVMVTVATTGMTPTDYLLTVRIYATAEVDAKSAQDTLDTLVQTIDARIGSTGRYGPSRWEVEFVPELAAFVASNALEIGREDQAAFG
jgi:hypothetical protein